MWLLDTNKCRLKEFLDDRELKGTYGILSHTWDVEEITFQDMAQNLDNVRQKKGYIKITKACETALSHGLDYVWVDTCCIDKRSSAELSEAINSMYRWYWNAKVCFAYLSDVEDHNAMGKESQDMSLRAVDSDSDDGYRALLEPARWFRRGWTLQELLAPRDVRFYDRHWNFIGTKSTLVDSLSQITNIEPIVLRQRRQIQFASIAKRMSWASGRSSSREEDEAYCLLGIFNVNIPLLYGEGKRSFLRLQEEIIRTRPWADHSILAHSHAGSSLLAVSPDDFRHASRMISWPSSGRQIFELSSTELRVMTNSRTDITYMEKHGHRQVTSSMILALNCSDSGSRTQQYVLRLRRHDETVNNLSPIQSEQDESEVLFSRDGAPISFHRVEVAAGVKSVVHISRTGQSGFRQEPSKVRLERRPTTPKSLPNVPGTWDDQEQILTLEEKPIDAVAVQLGLRWLGSLELYLPKALDGPDYHVFLHIETSTESREKDSPTLWLMFSTHFPPTEPTAAQRYWKTMDPTTGVESGQREEEEEEQEQEEYPMTGKWYFLDAPAGQLTLQRDDQNVLKVEAKYSAFDGEMMWTLSVVELTSTFQVA